MPSTQRDLTPGRKAGQRQVQPLGGRPGKASWMAPANPVQFPELTGDLVRDTEALRKALVAEIPPNSPCLDRLALEAASGWAAAEVARRAAAVAQQAGDTKLMFEMLRVTGRHASRAERSYCVMLDVAHRLDHSASKVVEPVPTTEELLNG